MALEVVFQDDQLIAINKPHGLLVHRSSYAKDASQFAIQLLRDQAGCMVYPCHRLDRKTGGALLFALDRETNIAMQQLFARREVKKKYMAIVRGYTENEGVIDYPLTNEKGKKQQAVTRYQTMARGEVPLASGKFKTSRYSLIEIVPETGRMHQIRKDLAHIFHPIIGDRPHGCNKQNRFFKEHFAMITMLLHASGLSFHHPVTGKKTTINAACQSEFWRMLKMLGLN